MTSSRSAPETTAEYEAAFDELLAEMRLLNERMQRDRADIDRIKAETRLLKAEAERLEAETRATLARLKTVV